MSAHSDRLANLQRYVREAEGELEARRYHLATYVADECDGDHMSHIVAQERGSLYCRDCGRDNYGIQIANPTTRPRDGRPNEGDRT